MVRVLPAEKAYLGYRLKLTEVAWEQISKQERRASVNAPDGRGGTTYLAKWTKPVMLADEVWGKGDRK